MKTAPTGWSPFDFALIGIGVGLAGTPASHSFTGSVPVRRVGHGVWHGRSAARPGRRAHESIFGALLTAGYAAAWAAIAASPQGQADHRAVSRTSSPSRSPVPPTPHSSIRSTRPRSSKGRSPPFLSGADWAYSAGIIALLIGAVIVFFLFPKKEERAETAGRLPGRGLRRPAGKPIVGVNRRLDLVGSSRSGDVTAGGLLRSVGAGLVRRAGGSATRGG